MVCWNCHARAEADHFCPECKNIQPTVPGTDYFAFFSLPPKLNLDPQNLSKRFYELSRKFHPDFFQRASEREREISTEKSSVLNKAYETLRDPWTRAEYAVGLEGLDAKKKAAISPELLDEVMTLQEEIEEKASASRLQISIENLRKRLLELSAKRDKTFEEWDRSDTHRPSAEKLLQLLHERKYLETALRNAQSGLQALGSRK